MFGGRNHSSGAARRPAHSFGGRLPRRICIPCPCTHSLGHGDRCFPRTPRLCAAGPAAREDINPWEVQDVFRAVLQLLAYLHAQELCTNNLTPYTVLLDDSLKPSVFVTGAPSLSPKGPEAPKEGVGASTRRCGLLP